MRIGKLVGWYILSASLAACTQSSKNGMDSAIETNGPGTETSTGTTGSDDVQEGRDTELAPDTDTDTDTDTQNEAETCSTIQLAPEGFVGSTAEWENTFDNHLRCGSEGRDQFFSYQSHAPGYHVFSTQGSSVDTSLGVFDDCDETPLACNEDVTLSGTSSEVAVWLDADQEIIVLVDTPGGTVGEVSLSAHIEEGIEMGGPYCDDAASIRVSSCEGIEAFSGTGVEGNLGCSGLDTMRADVFALDAEAGDCVTISVDNTGSGRTAGAAPSYPILRVEDEAGERIYLPDWTDCSAADQGGASCAHGSFSMPSTGELRIYVSTLVGAGGTPCSDGSPYTLYAARNGEPADILPAEDDVLLICSG